jgi:predicted nucleic-acid-binding Zn-ribbon protein
MKCLNCGSTNITDALAMEDDGAYPAGNHKVTTGHGRSRMSKKPSTRLAARVCTDCGFTALFAEDPSALSG